MYVEREGDVAAHFLLCCTEPAISLETKQLCIKADASWRVPPPAGILWTALSDTTRDQEYGMHRPAPAPWPSFRPGHHSHAETQLLEFHPAFPSTTAWRSPMLMLIHSLYTNLWWSRKKNTNTISGIHQPQPLLHDGFAETIQLHKCKKKGAETDSQISFCSQIFRLEPNQELPHLCHDHSCNLYHSLYHSLYRSLYRSLCHSLNYLDAIVMRKLNVGHCKILFLMSSFARVKGQPLQFRVLQDTKMCEIGAASESLSHPALIAGIPTSTIAFSAATTIALTQLVNAAMDVTPAHPYEPWNKPCDIPL